jgi:hypothetical protein
VRKARPKPSVLVVVLPHGSSATLGESPDLSGDGDNDTLYWVEELPPGTSDCDLIWIWGAIDVILQNKVIWE